MKPLGEGAAKAARHRRFHWCRRPNGFSDMPVWRVVARQTGLPVVTVLAFVNRLEELGNAAANFGEVRGALSRFSASEFAEALGLSAEDCARLYAALERPEIGWIAYDHIADFYDRNPDREDETAAERQRRKRLRDRINARLAKLARSGKIDERRRADLEALLGGTEKELQALELRLARLELSTSSTGAAPVASRDVTRDIESAAISKGEGFPHVTRDSRMSQRDIVTVTPEQSRESKEAAAVDNAGAGASGGAGGLAREGDGPSPTGAATAWLDGTGRQLLIDNLQVNASRAEIYLRRWRDLLADEAALKGIIEGADASGYIGARFHTMITDAVRRAAIEKQRGRPLPLMPPRPGQRRDSA